MTMVANTAIILPEMILENLRSPACNRRTRRIVITLYRSHALAPRPVFAEVATWKATPKARRDLHRSGFGTVQRARPVAAAREAGDAAFDVLIACAFNYEASQPRKFNTVGRIPVLKARMDADLHMAEISITPAGHLFVIFCNPI